MNVDEMREMIKKHKLMESDGFKKDLEEIIVKRIAYKQAQEEAKREAMMHRSMMRDLMGSAMTDDERECYV